MKQVFADTHYWSAIANPKDPWREAARQAKASLGSVHIITTDEVLGEFLAALSRGGPWIRHQAVALVHAILTHPNVTVRPQSHASFLQAMRRYAAREDKSYSLTDCRSMEVMDHEGIGEILTHDHHFEQEGFIALISR